MKSAKIVRHQKSFWTPVRLALTLATFALLTAFGVSSCNSTDNSKTSVSTTSTANAPTAKGPVIVKQAPTNTTQPASIIGTVLPEPMMKRSLTTLTGKSLKLSDYAGKVMVLNLWASWCGPCRIETPELVKLSDEYKSKGVEVIGVTTQENDPDIAAIKNFVAEQKVPYNVVYTDNSLVIPLLEGRNSIPQSFVISRDGHILQHFVGFSPTRTPDMLRAAIDAAL